MQKICTDCYWSFSKLLCDCRYHRFCACSLRHRPSRILNEVWWLLVGHLTRLRGLPDFAGLHTYWCIERRVQRLLYSAGVVFPWKRVLLCLPHLVASDAWYIAGVWTNSICTHCCLAIYALRAEQLYRVPMVCSLFHHVCMDVMPRDFGGKANCFKSNRTQMWVTTARKHGTNQRQAAYTALSIWA